MAKKSPSAAKKTKPTKTKTAVKAPAKAVKKPAVKATAKTATKAAKPIKKEAKSLTKTAAKPAAKMNSKAVAGKAGAKIGKPSEVSKLESSKPALMTKKGKAEPVVEAIDEVAVSEAEAAPAKAEKVSKVKPIRIEKGNLDDEKAKWNELFKKYGKDKAIPYKMSDTFPSLSPVQHKVLGWGFILKNDNDRMEVLFETGIRMLISNYKS